jgi:hypothetical protein
MRWLAILIAAMPLWAQTRVQYPSQVSEGPLYVSQSLAGLPTVCSGFTPFWIVGNTLYQNQSVPPACNWMALGFLTSSGTPNSLLKFTSPTAAGNSGVTDNGTTVSTGEAVVFTGPTNTIQVVATVGALPSTGCTPGQLAVVLGASTSGQIYETAATAPACSWAQQGGAGGGATIAVTTNLISGDGAGNGANSGIAPANVIVSTGSYSNPGWISALAGTKITCCVPVADGGTGTASPSLVAGTGVTITGSWPNQTINSTGGGGGTIPNTTNLLKGDGSGNAADSGIGPTAVLLSIGSYSNPGWLTAISAAIITSGTLGCSELSTFSGDVTNSGCAVTVAKINGAVVPTSANLLSSNSSKQLVASTAHNASVPITCAGTANSGSAETCTTTPTFSPTSGDHIQFIQGTANVSGSFTIAINGGSAITVKKRGCAVNLAANDILAGEPVILTYNGTNLCLLGDVANLTTSTSVQSGDGAGSLTASTAHGISLPAECVGRSSDTGTAMTCTTSPTFTPGAGDMLLFHPHLSNTGTTLTLNVNGSGAASVYNSASVAISVGDLPSTSWLLMLFDGTNWQIEGQTINMVRSVSMTVPSWLSSSISSPTIFPSITISAASGQTSHKVIGTCGTATSFGPCSLVPGDLPTATSSTQGIVQPDNTTITISGGVISAVAGGAGTVTSVGLTMPTWLSVANSPITTSGTLAVTPTTGESPHLVIGTCGTNTTFAPCNLAFSDLPVGTGTVTSVGLSAPSWLSVTGSPVTASGSLTLGAASGQTAHQVIGTCGTATSFTPCALVPGDLPTATSSALGVVRPDNSTITVSGGVLSATGSGSGTVTSVGLSMPGWFTVSNSPVTNSGTLTATANNQSANQVLAGPSSGSATTPAFRALVAADIPSNIRARSIGASFGVKGGAALTSSQVVYLSVPFSCTITSWTAMVDSGTIIFDVWMTSSGSSVPTVSNSITASALPAIASGTAASSSTLTGWTTSVSANNLFAFDINAVSGATTGTIQLTCGE